MTPQKVVICPPRMCPGMDSLSLIKVVLFLNAFISWAGGAKISNIYIMRTGPHLEKEKKNSGNKLFYI